LGRLKIVSNSTANLLVGQIVLLLELFDLDIILHLYAIELPLGLHLNDLLGRPDINLMIALLQVHGIEHSDLVPMDDVLEVPAYDEIGPRDRRQGDMMGIGSVLGTHNARLQIGIPERC
jgi:hypothetical protein